MEQNLGEKHAESRSLGQSVWEWSKVILIALLIALPIRFFIAEPFVVNGASMDPTFSTGQFLIVDRLTYRIEAPKRGDVIVFKYPENPTIYFIKRIIGLPGETVDIQNGVVTITTVTATGTPVHAQVLSEPYIDPAHASHDTYHKTLADSEYFVMGDNRSQSSDSRAWGALPSDLIIGRPIVRLFPVNTLSVLPGAQSE